LIIFIGEFVYIVFRSTNNNNVYFVVPNMLSVTIKNANSLQFPIFSAGDRCNLCVKKKKLKSYYVFWERLLVAIRLCKTYFSQSVRAKREIRSKSVENLSTYEKPFLFFYFSYSSTGFGRARGAAY